MQQQTSYEYPACRHQVISYPLQVWLLSLLSTPLLAVTWSMVSGSPHAADSHPVSQYFDILFSQVIFTIPSVLVYMLVFWFLGGLNLSAVQTKVWLALSGVACFCFIFFLFPGNIIVRLVDDFLLLFVPLFVMLSLALKLKKEQ